MVDEKKYDLGEILSSMGDAGNHLFNIGACEAAAGNLSICIRESINVEISFNSQSEVKLPVSIPELSGATFVVSGSGCRLRDIKENPFENLGCLKVNDGGMTAILYKSDTANFTRLTSEFNSHLAVHYDQLQASRKSYHAIVHAQPIYLTFLSHIPRYQDFQYLNSHLFRWQPETILNLPEGIGFIPFLVPGSTQLMDKNVEILRDHPMVIWAKHGVMARSDHSIAHVIDLIEYAEAAAHYEYLNLCAADSGHGLSVDEIREICDANHIQQKIF